MIRNKPITKNLSTLLDIRAHLIYSVNKTYSPEGDRQRGKLQTNLPV